MSDLKKVSSGQKFKPQSGDWNAFVDAARYVRNQQTGFAGETGSKQPRSGIIRAYNTSGDDMTLFAPAIIGDPVVEIDDEESALEFLDGIPMFEIAPIAEDDEQSKPFCILLEPIDDDEIGKAVIAGLVPVKLYVENSEHQYAVPDTEDVSRLKSAESGSCRIIWKADDYDECWALVLLGGGSGAAEYNGPFKLIKSEIGLEVVSGMDAEDATAGYAMLNGEIFPVASDYVQDSGEGYVCLQSDITDDGTGEYSHEESFVIAAEPSNTEDSLQYPLGYVMTGDDGEISQIIQFHHALPQLWFLGECKSDESASS